MISSPGFKILISISEMSPAMSKRINAQSNLKYDKNFKAGLTFSSVCAKRDAK